MIQCRALFLSKPADGCKKSLQPFINGELDESVTECHSLTALNLSLVLLSDSDKERAAEAAQLFANKGLAAIKLQNYFLPNCSNDVWGGTFDSDISNTGKNFAANTYYQSDDFIRRGVETFWNSPEGNALLHARYPDTEECQLHILATHVTRRKAPPDGMSLVHIDYPATHDLSMLTTEWWSRWKEILPRHESIMGHERMKTRMEKAGKDALNANDISNLFHLVGVVTTWICLQPYGDEIQNYPLIVADASTVQSKDLYMYKVGKKHSVGVYFDREMKWFHVPNMKQGDAWCFDTTRCPHVSVDLKNTVDFVRESAEVRCLVLAEKP